MGHALRRRTHVMKGKSFSEIKEMLEGVLKTHLNAEKAAQSLGTSRQTIIYWIKKLKIPYNPVRRRHLKYDLLKKGYRDEKKTLFNEARELIRKGYSLTDIGIVLFGASHPGKTRHFYASKLRFLLRHFGYHKRPGKTRVDGVKLRIIRRKKGLKQKDLGCQTTVHVYEKNGTISLKNLRKLAEILEVDPEDLMLKRDGF